AYGRSDVGAGRTVLVEFVSANPTGPLHVGHGRGAAYGDSIARILDAAGFHAQREYYVNDAGRQMDILALSVWLRHLESCADTSARNEASFAEMFAANFPPNAYQGDYIRDLAAGLRAAVGMERDTFDADAVADANIAALFDALPDDGEARLDELIRRCRDALGERAYRDLHAHACDAMVADIRADLSEFGVRFDNWFSERSLLDGGEVERAIAALARNGHIYERDGAQWFRATAFGDDKDRAVIRANGSHTYFASDIAYHFNKGERGFDQLLNVFGADHHGYAKRIQASFEALGNRRDRLRVLLVQFAALYRAGVRVTMSTRGGEFVALRELREEVGNDAARFFYVSRKNDQHMEFDLDLAKTQSADNPVYYIQYAHARICSVFRQTETSRTEARQSEGGGAPDYALLVESREIGLMRTLSRFPEVVEQAALGFEPHLVAYYLRELATDFHAYYNAHPFLSSEDGLRRARLGLIDAARQVIANGLDLIGVGAPERM
ncbi:MAG: arginine--tRNA ligase, partial [bacterium]